MTPGVKVVFVVVFLFLGLGYLYRPDLISRMNAVLRDYLLNDSFMALERRKWGMFFLLMSFLLTYMGYTALQLP
mgnify:CR=1 FL=1